MSNHERNTPKQEKENATPGPTTGGMGSLGARPDEASLEEKLGVPDNTPTTHPHEGPKQAPGTVRQGPPPSPEQPPLARDEDFEDRPGLDPDEDERPLRSQ